MKSSSPALANSRKKCGSTETRFARSRSTTTAVLKIGVRRGRPCRLTLFTLLPALPNDSQFQFPKRPSDANLISLLNYCMPTDREEMTPTERVRRQDDGNSTMEVNQKAVIRNGTLFQRCSKTSELWKYGLRPSNSLDRRSPGCICQLW